MDRGRVEAIEDICGEASRDSWLDRYVVNVYRMGAHFGSPTKLGDQLEVRTGLRKRSTHRAAFDQRVVVPATGEVVVDSVVEVLFLGPGNQLAPVPEELSGRIVEGSPPHLETLLPSPFGKEDLFPWRRRFRVYFEDTDAQGIAYHVSYVRFCERALTELLCVSQEQGTRQEWLERHPSHLTRLQIRYLQASRLGDRLEVRTGGRPLSESELALEQRIVRIEDGTVLANAIVQIEFRDESGASAPVPPSIVETCAH
jgi:acyl-CoA thioester hydrolase